jgi:myo-inositol-1(or 4)-monophosphatase
MTWQDTQAKKAEAIVRQVGQWIQAQRNHFQPSDIETKSLNALVSYVDREAEEQLIKGLQTLLPGSGVLGEEGGAQWVEDGYNWIIDPLDGTTNFMHDLPPYAVSVALMEGVDLIWAAVYELGQSNLYTAIRGKGAWLDDQRLDILQGPIMEDSLVATGFPYYDFEALSTYLDVLQSCFKGSRGVRRFGSAATDLSWVAEGRFQAFFEHGLAPWDVAAGILLVREAGGEVTTFHQKAENDFQLIHARQIVAGNPSAQATLYSWTQNAFTT